MPPQDPILQFLGTPSINKLEGKIYYNAETKTTAETRITKLVKNAITFDPLLQTIQDACPEQLDVLNQYLQNYIPLDRQGMLFRHQNQGKYTIQTAKSTSRLSLYVEEERDWGQGHIIDILPVTPTNQTELEWFIALFQQRKISSFVYGEYREHTIIDKHHIIKRYFLE